MNVFLVLVWIYPGKEEGKGGLERRKGGKGKGKKERENMKIV